MGVIGLASAIILISRSIVLHRVALYFSNPGPGEGRRETGTARAIVWRFLVEKSYR